MLGLIRNVEGIATSRDLSSRRLATTYATLRLRRATSRPPRRAKLLDWEVAYTDYPALVELFEEIFIRRHYPFHPRRPDPFVVDCGANIGVATLYFKSIAPGAEVLAFEPEPTAFGLLEENVHHNGLEGVTCVQAALAAASGRQTLRTYGPAHGGASLEFGGAGWTSTEVDAVRLSDRIGDRHVDFLKLDVEGSEQAILADLVESGAIGQVGEIALEHHPGEDSDLAGVLATLAEAGFEYRIAIVGDRFWESGQLLLVHALRA